MPLPNASVKYAPVNRHCFHMLMIVNGWMDRWIVGCMLMGVGVKVGVGMQLWV